MPVAILHSCLYFWPTDYRSEFPRTSPSLGLVNLLEWLTELRWTLTYIYQLVKGYVIKHTEEHSEGRGGRWREGVWAGQGLSWPVSGPASQHLHVLPRLEALQAPSFWDFMEATSHRHAQSLTPLSAPSLLKRMWGVTENSKLLIKVQAFRWPALIQELTQCHLLRTKALPSPRKLQGF